MHMELIGVVDVDPIYNDDHFAAETWRQDATGTPHSDTQSIYWRMPRVITYDTVFHSLECVDRLSYHVNREMVDDLCRGFDLGKPARVMLVKLKAGGRITPHVDQGAYAEATNRYHLPLVTNDRVFMRSGNEIVHMMVNELWSFDKHVEHSAENQGDEDRIHLILDTFKNYSLIPQRIYEPAVIVCADVGGLASPLP